MSKKLSSKTIPGHIWREIELQQGDASERYLEEVLRRAKGEDGLPPWFIDFVRHEKWSKKDMAGVDFTIITNRGKIDINTKSSRARAKQFEDNHKNSGIIAISVNILEPEEEFLGRFVTIIGNRYRQMRRC